MSMTPDIKPRSALSTLCAVVGLLLTLMGGLAVPVGLFVGPHLLCGALLELLAGVAYLVAGCGHSAGKR